jgi:hypothetical protein
VTFEAGPYVYRGSAFTATAAVSGDGVVTGSPSVTYTGDCQNVTVANGCTATATYAGDANHNGSSDAKSITVNKANPIFTVTGNTCNYSGSACEGTVTAVGRGQRASCRQRGVQGRPRKSADVRADRDRQLLGRGSVCRQRELQRRSKLFGHR